MIIRKSRRELERMAAAGSIVARTLDMLRHEARAGVTTGDLDALAEEFIRARGRHADLQGLPRLPGLDLLVAERHDRPRHPRPLRAARRRRHLARRRRDVPRLGRRLGDHGRRSARSRAMPAGCSRPVASPCSTRSRRAAPARHLSDIGHAVQTRVEGEGFGVVRALVGHGVGRRMHEDPQVPELRASRPRPGARRRHGAGDRADDHGRRPCDPARRRRRLVDLHRRRLARRRTSSTRSPSRSHGPLVLTRHDGWSPVDEPIAA